MKLFFTAIILWIAYIPLEPANAVTYYVIPKDGLNMRKEPSAAGKKILTIPQGAAVQKLDENTEVFVIDGIEGRWLKISWKGRTGWAFGGFLSAEKNTNKTEKRTTIGTLNDSLLKAAAAGNAKKVKKALDEGANINTQEQWSEQTPLMEAVENGHIAVIKLLIDRGADLDLKDRNKQSAIMLAANTKRTGITKMLLEKGAKVEYPLHFAASIGDIKAVKKELEQRSVDPLNAAGCTPLFDAAQYKHTQVAKVLIDAGADVNWRSTWGFTPLRAAAQSGSTEIVKMLLAAGANVDQEAGGETALTTAVESNKIEVVRLLIRAKANLNAIPYSNTGTALSRAKRKRYWGIANLLRAAGAKE